MRGKGEAGCLSLAPYFSGQEHLRDQLLERLHQGGIRFDGQGFRETRQRVQCRSLFLILPCHDAGPHHDWQRSQRGRRTEGPQHVPAIAFRQGHI